MMKKKELDSDKKEELNSNSHERKVKEINMSCQTNPDVFLKIFNSDDTVIFNYSLI